MDSSDIGTGSNAIDDHNAVRLALHSNDSVSGDNEDIPSTVTARSEGQNSSS